jgi:hypothetical protein
MDETARTLTILLSDKHWQMLEKEAARDKTRLEDEIASMLLPFLWSIEEDQRQGDER